MKGEIIRLKAFIQTYLEPNDNLWPEDVILELKVFVSETLSEINAQLEDDFFNLNGEQERKVYIQDLQSQLVMLGNTVSFAVKDDLRTVGTDVLFNELYQEIICLLERLRSCFSTYFNFEQALPHLFMAESSRKYAAEWHGLINGLRGINIDHELVDVIDKLLFGFSDSNGIQINTWREWRYLLVFAGQASSFVKSFTKGDPTLRFLEYIISQDFNSIYFYAYFLKFTERITLGDLDFQEQQEKLLYIQKVFKQAPIDTNLQFNPTLQPLKVSVLEGIMAELQYLSEREKLHQDTFKVKEGGIMPRFFFDVTVTLAELMFLFRLMLETGFMNTKFRSHLYEFINSFIRTQRAENLSRKSMRNHLSNKSVPDKIVDNIRSRLYKMITHIDLYYIDKQL